MPQCRVNVEAAKDCGATREFKFCLVLADDRTRRRGVKHAALPSARRLLEVQVSAPIEI
jgi:hypothetical protein